MSDQEVDALRPILVDTNVFSRAYLPKRRAPSNDWVDRLFGRTLTVAVQTVVELRSGARMAGWGDRKIAELEAWLGAVQVIPVTDRVQASYVDLTAWARAHGHAIHDKPHVADRWIAASAMAWELELASDDGIFDSIDGLRRLAP